MHYTTVYVGTDVHKETILSAATQMRRKKRSTFRKSTLIIARSSTTLMPEEPNWGIRLLTYLLEILSSEKYWAIV